MTGLLRTLLTCLSVASASLLAISLGALEHGKAAEGEYVMETIVQDGNRTEVFTYVELWTLWCTADGYEVESKTNLKYGEEVLGIEGLQLRVRLSPQLHSIVFDFSGTMPGLERRGEMTLEIWPEELRWRAISAIDGKTENAKLAMEGPYDVFLPSPWSWSSIVRQKEMAPGERTTVQVVYMDDDNPIDLIPAKLDLEYLGPEMVSVAKQQFEARKFELGPGELSAGLVVWISADGILLAMEDAKKPEQRMELKRFEKSSECAWAK